jgi:hypothetical protein
VVAHAPAISDGLGLSPDNALVWRAGERQMIGTAREPVTLNVMQAF